MVWNCKYLLRSNHLYLDDIWQYSVQQSIKPWYKFHKCREMNQLDGWQEKLIWWHCCILFGIQPLPIQVEKLGSKDRLNQRYQELENNREILENRWFCLQRILTCILNSWEYFRLKITTFGKTEEIHNIFTHYHSCKVKQQRLWSQSDSGLTIWIMWVSQFI